MPEVFLNRADAGRQLAQALQQYRNREDVLVLALPRGGVPVAEVVARKSPVGNPLGFYLTSSISAISFLSRSLTIRFSSTPLILALAAK
jgi:hypothetical protein